MKYQVRYGYLEQHWFTVEVDADGFEDIRGQFDALAEKPDRLNLNPDDADYSDFVEIDRLIATEPDGVEIDINDT